MNVPVQEQVDAIVILSDLFNECLCNLVKITMDIFTTNLFTAIIDAAL